MKNSLRVLAALLLASSAGSAAPESRRDDQQERSVFTFSRDVQTCDLDHDHAILTLGTTKFVWALHDKELDWSPADGGEPPLKRHTKRGHTSLNLMNQADQQPDSPSWKNFSLHMNNTRIAHHNGRIAETLYHCRPFRLPRLANKNHIVKFNVDIQPGNVEFVHHYFVRVCPHPLSDEDLAYDGECAYSPDALQECHLGTILAVWAVGGSAFYAPQEAGFPIGGLDRDVFVLFQMHYDNPNLLDVRDSSGAMFWYTDDLRANDAAIMVNGHALNFIIPPRQKRFEINGTCPTAGLWLPPDGITVFATMPHAHLAGREIYTQHFRGDKELVPLTWSPYYDFDFQAFVYQHPPRKFLRGDHLRTTCFYDTMDRENETYAGVRTTDEMCMDFIAYYPASYPAVDPWTVCEEHARTATHVRGYFNRSALTVPFDAVDEFYTPPDLCKDYKKPEARNPVRIDSFNASAYPYHTAVDPDGEILLHWRPYSTVGNDDSNQVRISALQTPEAARAAAVDNPRVDFAVETSARGWVGLGVAPAGGMVDADVWMMFIDRDGNPHVLDRYAEEKALPIAEASQDLHFVTGGRLSAEPRRAPSSGLAIETRHFVLLGVIGALLLLLATRHRWEHVAASTVGTKDRGYSALAADDHESRGRLQSTE